MDSFVNYLHGVPFDVRSHLFVGIFYFSVIIFVIPKEWPHLTQLR